jgi:hypothetical protein
MMVFDLQFSGRNRGSNLGPALTTTMRNHRMAEAASTRQRRDYTIRSRADAKALGLKQYYTGKPCKHGHDAPRAVVNGTCMECVSQRHEGWRKGDPERARGIMKQATMRYRDRNPDYAARRYWADPEKNKRRSLERQRMNPEAARVRRKKWKDANPHKVNADAAKRRAALRKATPPWLTADHWRQIEEIYLDAATRPGGPWHVDHIYPLISDKVCGLHVPWNLQVITAAENWSKNNRTPEDFLAWKRRKAEA